MTTESGTVKRVKRKIRTSQNPLFEKWLKEWKDEASSKGSEMQYCYSRALKSLKKFPVKLYSGKECMMLENFGAKLCQKLDERLEAYKASNPGGDMNDYDLSVFPRSAKERHSDISSILEEVTKVPKKRKSAESSPVKKKDLCIEEMTIEPKKRKSGESSPLKNKKTSTDSDAENKKRSSGYVPTYRSGGFAILVAMLEKLQEDDFKGQLSKAEIEKYAEDLCDSSFKKPLPGSYYTAWSSMAVLIRKKLVNKEGKPARFGLTEEGVNLAIKLREIKEQFEKGENNLPSPKQTVEAVPKCLSPKKTVEAIPERLSPPKKKNEVRGSPLKKPTSVLSQEKDAEPVSEADETVFMMPGTFEIVLLVDTQERDEKFQHSDGMTMRQLKSRNVNFEIRHLKVGDFIWIARDVHNGFELVLPYIVERKRMDDLASSIKDGRFHEQKFRLKQSGIENLIYLVEKYGNENQRLGLPLPTLMQAISNTQVIEGFTVRITNNHDHSMRYLDCMTTQLSNLFKSKTLMSCKKSNLSPANLSDDLIPLMTFKDFNKGSEKNKKPTVRNMLVKHLVQLSGVSVEKAQAIVQLYPTPKALMEGLKHPSGEKSIADLTFGNFNRSIGPATAKQIRMLYTSLELR